MFKNIINEIDSDDFNFSKHLEQRIEERGLDALWKIDTIKFPGKTDIKSDSEFIFFKKIIE